MEIRRFKFVINVAKHDPAVPEIRLKRKKLEIFAASFSVNGGGDNGNAVGSYVSDDEGENGFVVKNSRSEAKGVIIRSYSSPSFMTPKINPELRLKFGFTSLCGRRRDMEDAIAVHPAFHRQYDADAARFDYFGVYDGHGCSHVRILDLDFELLNSIQRIGRESLVSSDWKSSRHDSAVETSGRWKFEVSFRCCAMEMPKRERREVQQLLLGID